MRGISHQTISLLGRWIAWRQGRMWPRVRSWPEVHLRMKQHGDVIEYTPIFCTIPATRPPSVDENVEEMGWLFLGLAKWQQYVIWKYFVLRRKEWKTFRKCWRISKDKLRSIFLDLQENAVRVGLVQLEERKESRLENAA